MIASQRERFFPASHAQERLLGDGRHTTFAAQRMQAQDDNVEVQAARNHFYGNLGE
jgi:hypothetical protein